MKSTLHSLVYVSSAVKEMSEFELQSLLFDCRRFNLESDVTGILLYSGGSFMQCIEGTSEALGLTFDRIKKSSKHHGVIEIVDEPMEARSFPDFQMGFVHASRAEALKASTEIWRCRVAARADSPDDQSCVGVLETFWQRAARAV